MDDQNKTQDQGFEFSGERSSQPKEEPRQASSSAYQFESSTTAGNASEEPKAEAPKQAVSKSPIQQKVPNSSGILTLGILSIVSFCCCWGLVGIVLAIIALSMTPAAKRKYRENPDLFTLSSYKNINAGQITAIIGISISIIWAIAQIFIIASGLEVWGLEESMKDLNEIFNETGY